MIRRPPRSTRLTHSFPTRRGAAMCNTSHEIMITSQNGGLVNTTYAGASPPPLPAGFTWKRNMVYSAQWQDDVTPGTSNNPTPIGANGWGIVNWMPIGRAHV